MYSYYWFGLYVVYFRAAAAMVDVAFQELGRARGPGFLRGVCVCVIISKEICASV